MAGKKIGVHGSDKETGRTRPGDTLTEDGKKKAAKVPDINKADFEAKAKAINLAEIFANRFADAKTFQKGSYGFFLNDKVTVMIDGKPVKCQANILLTVVNSKPQGEGESGDTPVE